MNGRSPGAAWLAAALCVSAAALPAQEVEELAYTTGDGATVHAQRIEIPAGRAEVWEAFSTGEGVMTWAAPFAEVDLRVGGTWESSYDASAKPGDEENIRIRILSYLPERMLALQAIEAPPGFPHPEILPELFSVVELESVAGDRTRVTIYGVGYRDTPAHETIREMFRQGDAWSLQMLHRRFAEGPIDWSEMQGGSAGG